MGNPPDDPRKRTGSDTNTERHRGSSRGLGSVGIVVLTLLLITATGVGTVAFGSGTAQAQTGFSSGDVDLEVFVPDNTFTPGQADELTLQVANDGEIGSGSSADSTDFTTSARNVRVEVQNDDAPIDINTGEQSIGTVGTNEPRDVPIAIDVPEDAEEGVYELDVELEYRSTSRIFDRGGTQGDRSHSVTREIEIEIDDGPRFELREIETEARIGDSGSMTAEIENVGDERAEDLTIRLESTSQRVEFGESTTESASLDSLDPEETGTVEYDVSFGPRASLREYPLEATVSFEDTEGISGVDSERILNVQPEPEQTFEIGNVDSTLRVGEEGEVVGTVTNTGPISADSVVVRYADQYPNIVPIESDVAVGTLEPGESADFELPVEISSEADAVPKSVNMAVTYRNEENKLRQFDDVDAFVDIGEQRDEFLLEVDNRDVEAGSSARIDVRVTNNLDETVTDVEAKLFTDSPLSSGDNDEGYTEALEPGESTTITFEISADEGATPRTYPLQMDFRYDDADGDSKVSDTYRTAIDVTESTDESLPVLPIVGVVLIVLVGGGVLYRRLSGA